MSAVGQERIASDRPVSITGASAEPTFMRVVPYRDEFSALPEDAPASCYRIGRCSAYDLYRFRDRPNRLTRLAPQAPPESGTQVPPTRYLWVFVPVTPEENIHSKYRTASQVRDEYRAAGTPIVDPSD